MLQKLFPVSVAMNPPPDMLMNADFPVARPFTTLSLIVAEPVGAGKNWGPMTIPSSPGESIVFFSKMIPVDVEKSTEL
jgi:hypothetical protein